MKNFITTLILFIIYLALKQDSVQTVFDEKKDNDIYTTYVIEMENLNTDNYDEYFNSIDVLAVIPKINPIYKDKLEIIYFDNNISELKKHYIRMLKEKGYYIEANKYLIMPVKIKKVIVCSSMNEIYEKINKIKKNYIITKSDSYVKITN